MTPTYDYKPLSPEPGTIRLIRLFKSPPADPISCELFEASFHEDDGTAYQALSYTWGSNAVTETIAVEEEDARGRRTSSNLQVTSNLHTALRHIRSQERDLVLWIDAICIDQGNTQEKGSQIGQMRLVYERAEEVLIWLGHDSDKNVEAAMDAMCRLHDEARADHKAWKDPRRRPDIASLVFQRLFAKLPGSAFLKHVEAVKGLLSSPWFQRVWVIQEVASARWASVLCGSKSAPAAIFGLMPSLLGVEVEKHTQAVLDIFPGRSRQESWWSKRRDLLYLLKMFASSQTSEPRDRIYALLGISSDASDPSVFFPDYKVSLEEALQNTLHFFMFGSTQSQIPKDKFKTMFPTLSFTALSHYADDFMRPIQAKLRWSVENRHQSTTETILSQYGFDIDRDLLYDLIEFGGYEELIEQFFLHTAVDLSITYAEGETLLRAALRKRDVTTAKLFLERAGIIIDVERLESLALDVMKGTLPAVSVLMGWTTGDDTMLCHLDHTSAPKGPEATGENKTLRKEVNIPYVENKDDMWFSLAARRDNVRILLSLVSCGAKLGDYRDAWGGTLLSVAAMNGSLSVVWFLLDEMNGCVDINSKDCDGRTALSFAAEGGHLEVLVLLASRGADRGTIDNSGRGISDWLEDTAGKETWRDMEEGDGSHLAKRGACFYGCEIAL